MFLGLPHIFRCVCVCIKLAFGQRRKYEIVAIALETIHMHLFTLTLSLFKILHCEHFDRFAIGKPSYLKSFINFVFNCENMNSQLVPKRMSIQI